MNKTRNTARSLMMIRLFAFLFIFSIPFFFVPQVVSAALPDSIDISTGDVTISPSGTTIDVKYGASQATEANLDASTQIVITGNSNSNKVIVNDNVTTCNITLRSATITPAADNAFSIGSGSTVNLTLEDTNKLSSADTGMAGLSVDPTSILTIDGTGSLEATGGAKGAGIGGNDTITPGKITINNGTVTANGGAGAAGIGGGEQGNGGTLTFNSGTITANGGADAAGIGGGGKGVGLAGGNGGTITINNGTITATGSDNAAGIGGGNGGDGGTILIADGTIEAIGGKTGAGIGGGVGEGSGDITITGGTINATAGLGAAGIGCGFDGGSVAAEINIKISGSAFIEKAQGGDADNTLGYNGAGAGIGTGGSSLADTPRSAFTADSIIISSGVDLARVSGGAADGIAYTAGAPIGSGGALNAYSIPYDTHTITYYDNADPETTQALTYTVNADDSDAVLPDLAFVQLHNTAFAPASFDGYWYETRTGGVAHEAGLAFTSTSITDLYTFGEPKTGL